MFKLVSLFFEVVPGVLTETGKVSPGPPAAKLGIPSTRELAAGHANVPLRMHSRNWCRNRWFLKQVEARKQWSKCISSEQCALGKGARHDRMNSCSGSRFHCL